MKPAPPSKMSSEDLHVPRSNAMKKDQILVDEAALESFPASDPPAWTPTHAGTRAHRSVMTETPRELRAKLRVDVERLVAGGRAEQAEYVTTTMLDTGRHIVRLPVREPPALEDVETVIRGAGAEGEEEVVFTARYANPSGIAVLLGLARVLTGRRFSRTVRLVGFADERTSAERYAKRLRQERIPLRGMISLDSVGFVLDRAEHPSLASRLFRPWRGTFLAFVGDRHSRELVEEARRAFSLGTRLEARSFAVPNVLPLVSASDQRKFAQEGFRSVLVTDTGPLRNRRLPSAKDLPAMLNYDNMADVVFGLSSVAARLAGGEASD